MLFRSITAHALTHPDKTAFIHNGSACSYAEFAGRLVRAVQFLRSSGMSTQGEAPGGVALICVEHLAYAWTISIALRHLGLTTFCAASMENAASLVRANTRCLVTWEPETTPEVAATVAGLGCKWVNVPQELGPANAPGPDIEANAPASPAGHIIPTSGTTGAYKLVLRSAAADASTLELHAAINHIMAESMVYVRDFPLWTAGGHRWPMLTWHLGATVIFQQWQDFHVPFSSCPLTHGFATPSTLMFVLREPGLPLVRNDSQRLLVTGGAMSRALVEALQTRLTTQVFTVLASTEALTLSTTRIDDLDDMAWHRIHPSREVQVVDDADQPLPAGQIGLLRARLLDGLGGYLGDPAASATFFRNGFFYSGDLAVFHADGRLKLCGRATDVVNLLGSKVATAPIESDIQNRLGVDAVCLLSVPLQTGGEEVVIAIECQHEPDHRELRAAANDLLSTVGRVHFFFFRQLPRNRMGKVLRLALHEEIAERMKKADAPSFG